VAEHPPAERAVEPLRDAARREPVASGTDRPPFEDPEEAIDLGGWYLKTSKISIAGGGAKRHNPTLGPRAGGVVIFLPGEDRPYSFAGLRPLSARLLASASLS
jgi:hypothetical protein